MTAIIILVVVLLIGWYFVSTQRELVNLDEKCSNALSQIAVQLNAQWDAVMNCVQLAKDMAIQEHEDMVDTIAQRRMTEIKTPADVNAQQGFLSEALGRLMVLGEKYPEFKAQSLYQDAMNTVKEYVEKVRISRQVYNDSATKMNRMVRQWPSSIVAGFLHFDLREYLKSEEGKEKMPDLGNVLGRYKADNTASAPARPAGTAGPTA